MFKNIFKITSVLIFAGFSFFYTDKVTKIIRNNDPIMIKINSKKEELEVIGIDSIIINDEYIAGVNGCKIDTDRSYSKMKKIGEYKDELLVMSEIKKEENIKNKYIISGSKSIKNISIILIIKNKIDDDLIQFLNDKKINTNIFVSKEYLENNTKKIKQLSSNQKIYYYGQNGKYDEEYMIYDNNLININTKNESNYCLVNNKDSDTLKLCSQYDMKTIKSEYIQNNILNNTMENLSNGSILTFDTSNTDSIKVSINYILSKGYKIVFLDKLLNSNICK